ncbi:hypothetical protein MASR2M79_10760 [Aminivibrio sp.]
MNDLYKQVGLLSMQQVTQKSTVSTLSLHERGLDWENKDFPSGRLAIGSTEQDSTTFPGLCPRRSCCSAGGWASSTPTSRAAARGGAAVLSRGRTAGIAQQADSASHEEHGNPGDMSVKN